MYKAHILAEIRRTAADNGGVPLGGRRFLTETGIKKSDWVGVYWARWSDALREAGFAPNQRTEAYSDAELLGRYAALARELGTLPADSDLRLKARKDPGFPSTKTFARLGPKAELVAKLAEYCGTRDGYQSVVELCEQYVPTDEGESEAVVSGDVQFGFVYLMKSGRFYKIGKTNAVGRREYELGIQLPQRPTTVHAIRTDDPSGIEAYWHRRFEAKRTNGEWFELDVADVAAFNRRKFM